MTDPTTSAPAARQDINDPHGAVVRDYGERDYRESWEGAAGAFEHRFEESVMRRLLPDQRGWWIEVGAGYGRLVPLYEGDDRKIVLVDYSMNLLEEAAQSNDGNDVFFVAANAYNLPFRDEAFDAALTIHTFAHINAPETFLGEIARVMRDGTRGVIEYPNKRSLFRILRYGLKSLKVGREEYAELFFGTHPKYFANLCDLAGLRVKATLGSGYLSRILKKAPFLGPVLGVAEALLMNAVGTKNLATRNFAQVEKVPAAGSDSDSSERADILDLLACPACRGSLSGNVQDLTCQDCGLAFSKKGEIFDLRYTGDAEVRPFAQRGQA